MDLSNKHFMFTRHARERMEQFRYSMSDFFEDSKCAVKSIIKDGATSYQFGHHIVVLKDVIHEKFKTPCTVVITVYDRRFDIGRKPGVKASYTKKRKHEYR